MTIDDALLSKLEKLSKLHLSDDERISIQQDLNKMLAMVDKLREVNTDDIQPLVYMNHTKSPKYRKDSIDTKKEKNNISAVPNRHQEFIKVPRVK